MKLPAWHGSVVAVEMKSHSCWLVYTYMPQSLNCYLCAQLDDQGLVQADPRNIAVQDQFPNMVPTDIRGLTFSRTPQMVRRFPPHAQPWGPCSAMLQQSHVMTALV